MRYIVVFDGEVLAGNKPMRGEFKQFTYGAIRLFLTELFPNHMIASPLEDMPPGGRVLGVYVSPNKEGVGRIDHNFQQWAVAPVST